MPEVAITGVGLVTPLGTTAADSFAAWRSGTRPETFTVGGTWPALAGSSMAEVAMTTPPDYDAAARLGGRKMLKFMSRMATHGAVAAREAVAAAGVEGRVAPEDLGLFYATGITTPAMETIDMVEGAIDDSGHVDMVLLGQRGLARTNPLMAFKVMANMPGSLVSMIVKAKGHHLFVSPWEEHAILAIREAFLAVADGRCRAALVGCADDLASPTTVPTLRDRGWHAPGTVVASGAGALVLERADDAPAEAVVATLTEVACEPGAGAEDPLAGRMGRTYSAAPAIVLGLAALGAELDPAIAGDEGPRCSFALGGHR